MRLVSPVDFRAEFIAPDTIQHPSTGGLLEMGIPKILRELRHSVELVWFKATDKRDEESPTIRKAIQQTFITKNST